MKVIIAGLETGTGLAYMGDAFPLQYDMQWYEAEAFFAKARDQADEEGVQWVWLYRAPWVLQLADVARQPSTEAMRQWQEQQRCVLQLRRYLQDRLVLVNIDRVDAHALARHLGVQEPGSLPCDLNQVAAEPLTSVLSELFEQIAPDCWRLYEALEAAAWLPEGEPEFQSARPAPGMEGLGQLLDALHTSWQMPKVLGRIQLAESREQQAVQSGEASRQAMLRAEATCQTLTEGQQRLQAELRDSVEQLEEMRSQAQLLAGELDTARNAATRAEQHCKQLQQERDTLEKQLAITEDRATVANEESETLLTQLHQVQEELEKHHLDGAAIKNAHAKLKEQLEQSLATQKKLTQDNEAARKAAAQSEDERKKLSGQVARLQKQNADDAKRLEQAAVIEKQLLQERDEARKAMSQAEQSRKKLMDDHGRLQHELSASNVAAKAAQDENELLFSQLHEAQEALEKHHLEGAALMSAHARLKEQLEQSLAKQERSLQERDEARAMMLQAEEARQKLMNEQARLQKETSESNAAAKAAQDENELLFAQLHQVQEELEGYYLSNRQILTVMEQSETTMERARKALIRLAHG